MVYRSTAFIYVYKFSKFSCLLLSCYTISWVNIGCYVHISFTAYASELSYIVQRLFLFCLHLLGCCQIKQLPRRSNKKQNLVGGGSTLTSIIVPFGVTYEKIGTIQRRLAWPLHKDDTLFRSGRPTGLNVYFVHFIHKLLISCWLCVRSFCVSRSIQLN